MTEKKQSLSGVLNLRIDDALSREVERIAKVDDTSSSEAARKLLAFGVEVQRRVEASYLRLPYTLNVAETPGRVVINAEWKPYTSRELWEMEDEARAEAEDDWNRS